MNGNDFNRRFRLLENIIKLRPLLLGLIVLAIVIVLSLTIRDFGRSINKAVPKLTGIAEGFKSGKITETFISSLPQIRSTNGDVLELFTHKSTETFRLNDSKQVFWGILDLGENIVEIRVPVTYRYHLKLSEKWKLDAKGNTCIVYAPAPKPSLPPAIHTDGLEKYVIKQGWARNDADEMLGRLERKLTGKLSERAADPEYMNLVRETCRQSTAAFVRTWLLSRGQWSSDKFTSIKVIFPDEAGKDEEQKDLYLPQDLQESASNSNDAGNNNDISMQR